MKIRIPRPDDPELAALWDEAKRNVVRRGRPVLTDSDCCVRDVSRCRCAAGQPVAKRDEEEQQWADVWSDPCE